VLRNQHFIREFWGKSDLGLGRHPDEDSVVLRNPPFKRGFWGKSNLRQGHPLIRTRGAMEPTLQKGILGEVQSRTRMPPDENRGVLRNLPFKTGFWGNTGLRQVRPLMRTRRCLGTHPSKEHSGGSPISDWDVRLMRTGRCLGTHPSKGDFRGILISYRDAPLMRTGGCLRTHPSNGHSRGSPISDRDTP
jgi:hypothetical protein